LRRESHINVDPDKLLVALNRRGMSAADLATAAAVSPTTLSALLHHGRPVSVRSARRIAKALTDTPTIGGLENLLRDEVA
jgi:lambda repressor-like predicted transcriptional regulator